MKSRKDKDDGYRGWLFNPTTGRTFKANRVTSRRNDLERIAHPGAAPKVKTSRRHQVETFVEPDGQAPAAEVVAEQASEAADAVAALLDQARDTSDKDELKVIGAQLGVKLTGAMNPETMLDRIETQVAAIQSAGG